MPYFTHLLTREREAEDMPGHPAIMGMAHVETGYPLFYDAMNEAGEGDLSVEGVNRLLEYPEFSDTEKLTKAGLDIPQITRLMLLLRERGIEVDTSIYTSESAYEEILKFFK